ncbi:putative MATE family efflux protein [Marinoscillum furvescens DSM 4134]|uniref:Putative MATE family efflux protein n=2 Tax=Marinoscillum furvescens TaxID=1026 RepID=A0A3D9KZF2_MARFU|nr:putative MATE family efflux protein [Marinoscillum furvescens DSM 4134]
MMLGILSMVAFNLVDTYFVGMLGSLQLAALSFTFPVIMVIFSIMQGLGIGATALISKSIGRSDRKQAARETTDSLMLSVLLAGVFIIIGVLTVEPTFRLLGASDEILPYVVEYMTIWYLALFFVIIPFVGNSAIRSTGDTRTPSMIMIFAVIINAILDPLLIFGYGPIPAMGLKGAATATAISRAMTMILSLWVLNFREKLLIKKLPEWNNWKPILWIGIPSGISKMIVPITTGVITALLARHGEFVVAGYGVATRVEFLAKSILFALSASIGPFSGQNFGAGNFSRIRSGVFYSNLFSVGWGLLVAAILFFFGKPIASIFTDDQEVINATALYLTLVSFSFGFQGVVQIVNSNINTLNKPLTASSIVFIQMLIIGIPLLYWLDDLYGVKGIYAAIAITYVIGGLISAIFNRSVMIRLQQEQLNTPL